MTLDRRLIWTPEEKTVAKNQEYAVDELSVQTDGGPSQILSHSRSQPHPFAVALLVATSRELTVLKERIAKLEAMLPNEEE